MVSSTESTRRSALATTVGAVAVASGPVWVAVIVVTLIRQQPLPGGILLALSSVALLLTLTAVQGVRSVRRRIEENSQQASSSLPTLLGEERPIRLRWRLPFMGPPIVRGLSVGPRVALLGAVCVGALAVVSTIPALIQPSEPGSPADSCEYRVGDRKTEVCVTRIDYERITLAGQRASAGLNLIVSALLAGALLRRPHGLGRAGGLPRPVAGPPMPDIDPGPDVDSILRRTS